MAGIDGMPNPPATDSMEAYFAMLAGVQGLKMPSIVSDNKEFYLRKILENGGLIGIGQIVIECDGDSGVFSDDEIKVLKNDSINCVIKNGDRYYRKSEENVNYATFTSAISPQDTSISVGSIYVNVNEEAVNYKTFSKEETVIGG